MSDPNMIGLIVEAALKSVLLAGGALAILRLLRARSAAERACIAHLAMAAVLALPLVVAFGPSLELPILPAEAPFAQPAASGSEAATMPRPAAALPEALAEAAPGAGPGYGRALALAAYVLPAALLLLLTLVAILRLFALRGRANVIVQQGWLSALAHAQRRMGIKHGTALLASNELGSPVSWGVLRPIILLNEEALDQAIDAEAVIAHELAHVARLDWLNLLVARFATALFWFNPLVWMLARQGHQLREEAADDAVLRADVPNADYAALLVGAARHEGKGMLLAANGVAPGKGSLSIRVHRILEPTLSRRPARQAWVAMCVVGVVAIAAPLAALMPARAQADPTDLAAVAPAPAAAPVPVLPAPAPVAVAKAQPAARPPAAARAAAPVPAVPAVPAAPASEEQLVAMRLNDVTPDYAASLYQANPRLNPLSANQLISLRVQGVTAQRLRDWAALGYGNLSYSELINFAVHGVTPNYIRSIASAGYARLPASRLIEFRIHGVTADLIGRLRTSGMAAIGPERVVENVIYGGRPPRAPRVTAPPPRARWRGEEKDPPDIPEPPDIDEDDG